jgi:hypothetical protein
MFGNSTAVFGLAQLQADPNCVLIQDPSAIWGGADHLPRRNLLLATDTLATQNVTVTAEAHTLYLQGTGSVTLSGTGSGTLQGTGANDRVTLAFTPTAGTLTLTVSGTVTFGMLCKSSVTNRSYQKITDWVTEQYAWAATKNVPWLRRNRFLSTATLSTQTVSSVTATPLTVSFTGTGKIDFTTAYTGTLQGTGAGDRVTATFTPAAGNLVCTVTGSVTLAQCEVGSAATPYQEVGASWAATYTSLALAAGYPISLYSDRAGTTATVGPDDQVGVLLDGSEGYAPGPELVTNGTFTTDTTGWTAATSVLSVVSGKLRVTTSGSWGQALQLITTVVGKTYRCSVSGYPGTAAAFARAGITGTDSLYFTNNAVNGSITFIFTATTTATRIAVGCQNATDALYAEFDNISVREIPGYHATAPSVAGSPTLRLDGNGKFYLDRDTTDDNLPITWPTVLSESQLGPELVSNGGFDLDTGWLKNSGATIESGVCRFTAVGSGAGVRQTGILVAGKQYRVTITVAAYTSGGVKILCGASTSGSTRSALGTYTELLTCAGDTTIWIVGTSASNNTLDVDNISVREVTGTNVIYTATGDYTTKDSGLILSGATDYKYPQRPSGDYGRIVMASESKYDSKIIKYLDQKRGRSYQLGPELVTALNFTSTWAAVGGGSVVSANSFSSSGAGGVQHPTLLTVGKAYLVVIGYSKSDAAAGISLNNNNGVKSNTLLDTTASSGSYSNTVSASTPYLYLRLSATATMSNVTLSVREILL